MTDRILHNLNPQQLEAVTAGDGPLLIIAGAGSGKTRVVTRRIAYLMRERHLRPYEIFAVTFTNKAAGEMKRRVAELAGTDSSAEYHIGTFHALCARILRREFMAVELPRNFLVCDERDQITAIKEVMRQLELQDKRLKPGDAQYVISQCKMRMLGPEDVYQVTESEFGDSYERIYRAYDGYLRKNGAADFEDLILHVVRLFQTRPDILEQYQRRYRYVLVDEYQDTNAVQFELVRLLASGHRNLAVVGDEDQSIYSWRGADIRNLLDFQKHFPEARLIRLEQNYRSTGTILKAADAVIAHNKQRLGKHLFTEKPEGPPIYCVEANAEFEESYTVAQAIERLVASKHCTYNDIAIFYRISALSRIYEDRLRQFRIPYRVVGSVRFYDRAEIKDLVAYLQLIENPDNGMALSRVINVPKRGLGQKSIQAIVDLAYRKQISMFEALSAACSEGLVGKSAVREIEKFVKQVRQWGEYARKKKPSEVLRRMLEATEYVESLGDPESMEVRMRTENIEELRNSIMQFERENPLASLQEYLESVSLLSSSEDLDKSQPAVSMMTLHSAKGLEFQVVFMVGMEEPIFPSERAIKEEDRLEEERRLFYVGITRAKEILVLTRSASRVLYGQTQWHSPSSFLREVPREIRVGLEPDTFCFGQEIVVDTPPARSIMGGPGYDRRVLGPPPERCGRFRLGMRVRHPLLGEGLITGLSGTGRSMALLIETDDKQTHKLLAYHANLEILDADDQ